MTAKATILPNRAQQIKQERAQRVEKLPVKQKTKRIQKVIRYADKQLHNRFSFLKYQNAIGLGIWLGSIAAMVATSWLYIDGAIPAWACIILNGIFASFLHELEHDLIHQCYFKDSKILESMMYIGIWIFRGNTVNPWYRRDIHRLHHRESGRKADIEERSITNGMKWGPLRLLAVFDPRIAGALVGHKLAKEAPDYNRVRHLTSVFPMFLLSYAVWDAMIVYGGILLAGMLFPQLAIPAWIHAVGSVVTTIAVIWVIPNIIRQASLVFISSNMHYYGDFEGEMLYQTQVLNKWYLLPLQVFCFNFGATHGIHHFVVNQPFYIRQMGAAWAHAAMKKYGVRFNDMDTFRRANRFYKQPAQAKLKAA